MQFFFVPATCPEKNVEYSGSNLVTNLFGMQIPRKKNNVPSWSECSKWCSTLNGCKAWSYSTIQRTCTAKTNNEQRRSAQGFVSGSRGCTEEVKPLDSTKKPSIEIPKAKPLILTRKPNAETPKPKPAGKYRWRN